HAPVRALDCRPRSANGRSCKYVWAACPQMLRPQLRYGNSDSLSPAPARGVGVKTEPVARVSPAPGCDRETASEDKLLPGAKGVLPPSQPAIVARACLQWGGRFEASSVLT